MDTTLVVAHNLMVVDEGIVVGTPRVGSWLAVDITVVVVNTVVVVVLAHIHVVVAGI